MAQDMSVGQRIAHYRRRRGLTQEVLAGLVGRSVPWLSLIERGERTVEKVADLLNLANVLKVTPADLIGGISLPANGGAPLDPPRGIHAISRALFAVTADREAPEAAELRAEVERVGQFVASGSFEARAAVLPDLILAGRAAAAQEVGGAWWCLARIYLMTSGLARTFGDMKVCWIALERAVAAAERSGDPLMVAHARHRLASGMLHEGWLDQAATECSNVADDIAPTDGSREAEWSLWGSLRLSQAVTVIRSGDVADAWALLREARSAAERVGPGRNDYWESFGPAWVGAHEVVVALESGNPVEALRIADRVDIEEWTGRGQRAAGFLLFVALAHGLRRDDAATVAALIEAERYSPQTVRYSVKAHELVRVLLGRERRSRTPGLRGLAERLGIAP